MTLKKALNALRPAGDLLAGLPDAPEGFMPFEFTDGSGAPTLSVAQVRIDGADLSGYERALRVVIPLAWGVRLVGGNVHHDRETLSMTRLRRAEAQAQIALLEKAGRDTREIRGSLEASDRTIETVSALVKAAEVWSGPDNVVLSRRVTDAEARHAELAARIEPYRRAGLPVPDPSLERDLYDAEKAVSSARAAFNAGRRRLDGLGDKLREATQRAYAALAGSLGNVEQRLGEAARRLVSENDPEFLAAFPLRAPDELHAIFNRAVRVSEIMAQLGAAHDSGLGRFWQACGPFRRIVRAKVTDGALDIFIEPDEPGSHPAEPHPDPIMNAEL